MKIPENIELVNGEICKSCGGKCCKHCGCSYSPDDFDILSLSTLKSKLEEGKISITSQFIAMNNNISYYLCLRARNLERDVIDLFSVKNTCASLTENGCSFAPQDRPQAGLLFIPRENYECRGFSTNEIAYQEWSNYQKVLERLVRYFSHKSSSEKIREDIINTTYYLMSKNNSLDIDINNFTRAEKEAFECLNQIIPTYEKEIKEGTELAKRKILAKQ